MLLNATEQAQQRKEKENKRKKWLTIPKSMFKNTTPKSQTK